MNIKQILIVGLVALSMSVDIAQGAIELRRTVNPAPAPGLESYTIRGVGTAGEVINSFAGINLTGGVHNVLPFFGTAAVAKYQWTPGPNGNALPEWEKYDTYFLLPVCDTFGCSAFGYFQETNDGSNPAGLVLSNLGFNTTNGLGTFKNSLPTDQNTIPPSMASSDVAFLQVVQPAGATTYLDVVLFSNTGLRADFVDFAIGVPEPGSLMLGFLGLLGIVGMCRNRR